MARKAGVSPITASRALRGEPLVAESTRMRVLQAAQALHYSPNLLARGLIHDRTQVVGILVRDLSNPFFGPIIAAAQGVAMERGYLLLVGQSNHQLAHERACLEQFHQLRIAGVLITPASADFTHIAALRRAGTPVVAVARVWEEGDCVTVDNFAGGCMVAQHLLRLGHRHMACLVYDQHLNTAVQARMDGFTATLAEAGFSLGKKDLLQAHALDLEEGERLADLLLEQERLPGAIFAAGDTLAIGCIHRLLERGVRVPDDVAVVGYDDLRYSQYTEVPLTTVALPKRELGRRAAELLFRRLQRSADDRDEPEHIFLRPRLVVRASCGAHSP